MGKKQNKTKQKKKTRQKRMIKKIIIWTRKLYIYLTALDFTAEVIFM